MGVLSTYLIVMLQFQFHFIKKELETNVTLRKPRLTALWNLTEYSGSDTSECVDILKFCNLTDVQLNATSGTVS